MPTGAHSPPRHRPGRRARRAAVAALTLLMLLAAAELIGRLAFGLGDPPRYVHDPELEYLNRPSSETRRFGNRIAINAYGMRSDPFSAEPEDPDELRIMVFGDSIVYGGAQVDQTELATDILRARLNDALERPVVVGNVAAGSWGPPNHLAYAKRYGFFDADFVVVVVSSQDAADVPTFDGPSVHRPASRPPLALWEVLTRYLPRYIARWGRSSENGTERNGSDELAPEEVAIAMDALRMLLARAELSGARVVAVVHPRCDEVWGDQSPARAVVEQTLRQSGTSVFTLDARYREALEEGVAVFRDCVHLTAEGQRLMADAFYQIIHDHLQRPPATSEADGLGQNGESNADS